MSLDAIKHAFAAECPSPNAKFVLLTLANHINASGIDCYPSIARIAEITGLSRSSVKRAIGELVTANLIAKETRRNEKGEPINNLYSFVGFEVSLRSKLGGRSTENPPSVHIEPTSVHTDPTPRSTQNPPSVHTEPLIYNLNQVSNQVSNQVREETAVAAPSKAKKPSNRGTSIPEGFPSEADIATARLNHPSVDPELEARKFRNYFLSATGQKATKRDWPATWDNWLLNARNYSPRKPQNKSASIIDWAKTIQEEPNNVEPQNSSNGRGDDYLRLPFQLSAR